MREDSDGKSTYSMGLLIILLVILLASLWLGLWK